jgi:hypothetical protein
VGALVYYTSERDAINSEAVAALGLGYVLDDGGVAQVPTARGPDGSKGVYFAAGGVSMRPAGLSFEVYPGKPRVWIGTDKAEPPTPEDLARGDVLKGHPVKLGDGQMWEVPVARYQAGHAGFPRRLTWSPEGWKPGDVVDAYKAIWDGACDFLTQLLSAEANAPGGQAVEFSGSDEVELAARALALNYRVSPAEISMLGLFDTETKADVCLALVDFPSMKKLQEADPPN